MNVFGAILLIITMLYGSNIKAEWDHELYFIDAHSQIDHKARHPWSKLFSPSGYRFKKSWKDLFIAYPERFIFALDNVWDFDWVNLYNKRMKHWKIALSELPEKTAHLIAHGNAERLWKLK